MTKYQILLSIVCIFMGVQSCVTLKTPDIKKKFSNINKEIGTYLEDYKSKLSNSGANLSDIPSNITAGFGELGKEDGAVGVCKRFNEDSVEIEIDQEYWKFISEKAKKVLIYHEATHCLCDRGHTYRDITYPESKGGKNMPNSVWEGAQLEDRGYFQDRCPKSLMHPRIPPAWCIEKYFQYYTEEMLEGCSLLSEHN